MVHVPAAASGVVNEQVVLVSVGTVPSTFVIVSALICKAPAPVFVTVTVAAPVAVVNVRVRTPNIVDSVPPVAELKVSVPGVTAVPVRVTGVPVPVAPVKATASVLLKLVPLAVPVAGVNTTL